MLFKNKFCILLIILLFVGAKVYSQESRTMIRVDFPVNSKVIEPAYCDNTIQLSEISSFLQKIEQDSTLKVIEVSFCGSASPEGSYQLNRKLARGRLEVLEDMVRHKMEIPDSIISRDDSYISWEYLKENVSNSNLPQKQAILDIINLEPRLVHYYGKRHIDHRIIKLQSLDRGQVWRQLKNLYFLSMRYASVTFVTYKKYDRPAIANIVSPKSINLLPKLELAPLVIHAYQKPSIKTEDWFSRLHLKTNALAWGLAISNIAAEIDIAKHWSFAMPFYYSAINYFTSTIKFRTLAIQPEVRYWFKDDNQGFFAGAHFGYAHYNIALNGKKTYQDHNCNSPALGGGASLGYRMPISKDGKWNIEFTLGAGVYGLHYDTFYNVNNGKLIETKRKRYCGIDNAAVNISYCFDLKKYNL